ncbi:HTH_Tnp_Tc3_2 domain-containing protein [Trichonephila clavipes]|nr:HTH_Tnp_Tc3_2 domain-containing protein [Trichonephila clavipes]
MNEKIAQFCVTVKKRTEVVSPPPFPRIITMVRREPDETILRLRIPLRRNRRQYEQLTDFDRGRIIGLREAGWSNRRIGRHLGRSDMVVARCWQQWITEGRVYRRGGSGRPRNTNDREDRAIRRVATSAPTTSLASIQRHLPPSRHPVPSRETIRRRLTEVGLRSRRPLRRLPLTPHHRQCRLDFCRPRATCSVMNPDSVSVLMTTAHVSGGAPASGPIRHLLSSGIQQFHKV